MTNLVQKTTVLLALSVFMFVGCATPSPRAPVSRMNFTTYTPLPSWQNHADVVVVTPLYINEATLFACSMGLTAAIEEHSTMEINMGVMIPQIGEPLAITASTAIPEIYQGEILAMQHAYDDTFGQRMLWRLGYVIGVTLGVLIIVGVSALIALF